MNWYKKQKWIRRETVIPQRQDENEQIENASDDVVHLLSIQKQTMLTTTRSTAAMPNAHRPN
jgi:hypothetical protein